MGLTGFSASNYLTRAVSVPPGMPFAVSMWARENTGGWYWTLRNTGGTSTDYRAMFGDAGSQGLSVRTGPGSVVTATTSTIIPSTGWNHLWGAYVATDLREALLNGGGKGTQPASRLPSADIEIVGSGNDPGENPSTGVLAEIALWLLTGFTETERDALATKLTAGQSPMAITAESSQPWTGMLLAYRRLQNRSDLADLTGNGFGFTETGELTNADHPAVDDPPGAAEPAPHIERADGFGLLTPHYGFGVI